MKAHTTYKIYPKAIQEFINDNYDLNSINFGNIENNVKAILQKLKLDTIIECQWDITNLYFFDKMNVTKSNNKPSDFDEFSNFKFSFTSLTNEKSTKEYESAIKKLESDFINKYQNRLGLEHQTFKSEELKKKRKKEMLIYGLSGLAFIILITVMLFIKTSQK